MKISAKISKQKLPAFSDQQQDGKAEEGIKFVGKAKKPDNPSRRTDQIYKVNGNDLCTAM